MRLHELAKEMEVDSKELLALARKLGFGKVKSHSSNLADGEAAILRVGYKFRDLEEEEIFDRLEAEAEEREKQAAEAEAKETAEAEAVQEAAVARKAEAAAEAAVEPAPAYVSSDAYVAEDDESYDDEEEDADVEVAESSQAGATVAATENAGSAGAVRMVAAKDTDDEAGEGEEGLTEGGEKKPIKPRRGAKILGHIQLDQAEINRSEETHSRIERGGPVVPGTRRVAAEKEDAQKAKRKQQKVAKWHPDPEDFAPVSAQQVTRPRFWERGPQRRQGRRSGGGGGGRRSKGPKKNLLADKKVIVVVPLSVKDFSQETGIRVGELLAKLMMTSKGSSYTINSELDEDAVLTLAVEFNRDIEVEHEQDLERNFLEKEAGDSDSQEEDGEGDAASGAPDPRPPVVTIMGHVDHGKTSLLDSIRNTRVVDSEHGGITQHTRAYQVLLGDGRRVTFLDTPGHRAFTEMRARGANCTDIVVLVVAADDGVMPQTREAIEHARAASPDMPIVIALNKADKPEANPMRVKQQLMELDLLPEEYGGKYGVVETDAITGRGIPELLERLALEAEIHDLRATNSDKARAYVIEASKEEGKGIHATVLVRDGTLRLRDAFLCGSTWGRVRMMEDDQGRPLKEAPPSTPVVVYGFKGDVPSAGDLMLAVQDEKGAEKVATERSRKDRVGEKPSREAVTLENLFASLDAGKVHEICVVLKADVQGSVEVLQRELESLKHDEVKVRVLRAGVGGITEEDVMLANTSQAVVIGFGVTADAKARRLQDQLGVDLRVYNVIYEVLDDLKKAMAGSLAPEESEKIIGHVEIREVFKVSRLGAIAGCFVTDGIIRRSDKVRVTREGKVVYTTGLDSLRRFKDDVREVKEGFECGLKLSNFDDVKVGDVLEVFEIVFEVRELTLQ